MHVCLCEWESMGLYESYESSKAEAKKDSLTSSMIVWPVREA